MRLCIVEDPLQNIESDYCGVFQLYFYDHLFGLNNDTKILNHENISKTTVQTLCKELFLLDQHNNGNISREYIKKNNITFD